MNRGIDHLFSKEEGKVRCNLCFRQCRLSEGKAGFCGVNINLNGVLKSLVYGRPNAANVDPVEKKPLYHFAPGTPVFSIGTVGCNYRCPFCQNDSLSFGKPDQSEKIVSNDIILQNAIDTGCCTVAFTYNEPTVSWLWFRDLAKEARKIGLNTVMVTNGSMSREVCYEMIELIDAVNVDLKCGNLKKYKDILKGDRSSVLENLRLLKEGGVWIELTTLLVPDISDSEADLIHSADEIRDILGFYVPWHLSAYRPAHKYKASPTSPEKVVERCDLLRSMGFYYVYPGNVAVSAETHCPNCDFTVITRYGYYTESNLNNGVCPKCKKSIEGRFL